MKTGTWLRNKETGEAVKVICVGPALTEYRNADVDGEVQTEKLHEYFDVLPRKPKDADDSF
jgi:hypothetical protein